MPITSIFHLSDIHIRKGDSVRSREQEYTEVFQNLFQELRQFPQVTSQEALIVLTGDIFHDKDLNSPCGEELIGTLLENLAAIAPTVIIRGNHDYRQDKPLEKDLITPHCKNIENLHYFNETGCFEVENIGIGLVSIQDALLPNATSGIVKELPPFPSIADFSEDVTHRIALFHGSITHAKLENGTIYDSAEGYPLDWFKEYDLILLGDIHLQQVNKAKRLSNTAVSGPYATKLSTYALEHGTWAYPGSLVQQKSSEHILGHGFLHWDLKAKQVTEYHVHNNYGIVVLTSLKEELVVLLNQRGGPSIPLEKALSLPWFPSHLQVRVLGTCNAELLDRIRTILCDAGKVVLGICESSIKPIKNTTGTKGPDSEGLDVTTLNSPETWQQFILGNNPSEQVRKDTVWQTWLTKPDQILIPTEFIPEQILKNIQTYNDSIYKAVELYTKELDSHVTSGRNTLVLQQVEWSWLFNFGVDNHYNFDDMTKKLVVLNAKNGHGKSNFFEVICLALFGDGFPSRDNEHYSAAIINTKVPTGTHATTRITFSLNNVPHCLERTFERIGGKEVIRQNHIRLVLSPSGDVVKEGIKAVKEWVQENIGDKKAFLASCMLTQDGDCNFFSSPKVDQKRLIDNLFSLNGVQRLEGLLKEANKCYKGAKGLLEAYLAGYMMKKAKAKGDADKDVLEEEIERLQGLLLELEQQIQEAHEEWSSYPPKTFTGGSVESYRVQLEQCEGIKAVDIDRLRDELQRLKGIVKGPVKEATRPEGGEVEVEGLSQKIRGLKEELGRLDGTGGTIGTMRAEDCRRILEDHRIWLAGWKREPGWPFEGAIQVDEKAYRKAKELVAALEETGRPAGTIRPGLEGERTRLKGVLKGLRGEAELETAIETLTKDAREYPETEKRCSQLSKDIQDCQHLIDQHASLPFNPKCDACKAQPWRPALEDAKKRIGLLKEERKKTQKVMGAFDELYESEAEIRGLLSSATKDLALLKKSTLELVAVENGLAASEWQRAFNDAKKKLEELEAVQKTQSKTVQYRKEEAEWTDRASVAKATLRDLLQWDIGLYESWLAYHTYQMSKEVERLGNCITSHQNALKREELEGKIAAFPAWELEQALSRQKGDSEASLQRAQDQLDQLNAGADDEAAQEALRVIELRQELLAHLSEAFKGYREWLYKNKLAPLIQGAVNELLVNICDGRPLSLEPEWLPSIDTFSWFLRDGVSRTIIEKASGFQRFITGMAMRVAMSRLGISGQTLYENLIIDEGFTACDGENLEKVPAFLKALIADQNYKGVVLATHLEELKACGDKQISIERDGISGISSLRAGEVRNVLTVAVEKAKRGKKKVGGV